MPKAGIVHVVVGGQYGSEGKGAVAAALVRRTHEMGIPTVSVRVGGPNAGHTAYDPMGTRWALRCLPVGAVVDPGCVLYIAAGSEVDPDVLHDEAEALETAGIPVWDRLLIDNEATVITPQHRKAEQEAALTASIGSTAKGIGAARAERLWRRAPRVKDVAPIWWPTADNTARMLRGDLSSGASAVIEGTQGYALGLHAGHYPHCTAGDVTAIDALAQVGLSPWDDAVFDLVPWVVLRAYPIRVAGNSGPLQNETSWDDLGLPEEQTTVTRKTRRVGGWDWDLAKRAVEANGGSAAQLALTMLDHLHPDTAGQDRLSADAMAWVKRVQDALRARVCYAGTGPQTAAWL